MFTDGELTEPQNTKLTLQKRQSWQQRKRESGARKIKLEQERNLPTNTRREKLATLNNILEVCRKHRYTYRTPALADKIATIIRPLGFGKLTEKEYIRLIVDALASELSQEKEFKFGD